MHAHMLAEGVSRLHSIQGCFEYIDTAKLLSGEHINIFKPYKSGEPCPECK